MRRRRRDATTAASARRWRSFGIRASEPGSAARRRLAHSARPRARDFRRWTRRRRFRHRNRSSTGPPSLTYARTLAGAPGFEPGYDGIKIRCLTTWRRPITPAMTKRCFAGHGGAPRIVEAVGASNPAAIAPRKAASMAWGWPQNPSLAGLPHGRYKAALAARILHRTLRRCPSKD